MFDLKAEVAADKDSTFFRYANRIMHSIAKVACLCELSDSM